MARRVRRIEITPEIFPKLFTSGTFFKIEDGVPDDAQFRGYCISPEKNCLIIFIEHESFEEIHESMMAPNHPPLSLRTYSSKAIQVFERFIETMDLELKDV